MKNSRFYLAILCFCFWMPLRLTSVEVKDLSLEEKVGQLLVVHFHGEMANEQARSLIQEVGIGGIIYYQWANGLHDPQQVQDLSQSLQAQAQANRHAIPLWIAVDQEGGRVCRLKSGFTQFPGNYVLGQTQRLDWAEESAWMTGRELSAVGVNFNLAPVVDVYSPHSNGIIGHRSYSSDPAQVALFGQHAVLGYQRAGILACLKHFPGHGGVQADSHETLPLLLKNREALEKTELYPFRFLAEGVDAIMTAHLLVPHLDGENCVTFSRKVVTDLLRHEMQYKGLILTDSLAMAGALNQCPSIEEAALKSLQAGHDMILLGGKQLLASQKGLEFTPEDIKSVHAYLVTAVQKGLVSEDSLNASVERILAFKAKYNLFAFEILHADHIRRQVNLPAHRDLAEKIQQIPLSINY
jgi:beta-N-acetylhexosaminidase